jgi:hypothetical protein
MNYTIITAFGVVGTQDAWLLVLSNNVESQSFVEAMIDGGQSFPAAVLLVC